MNSGKTFQTIPHPASRIFFLLSLPASPPWSSLGLHLPPAPQKKKKKNEHAKRNADSRHPPLSFPENKRQLTTPRRNARAWQLGRTSEKAFHSTITRRRKTSVNAMWGLPPVRLAGPTYHHQPYQSAPRPRRSKYALDPQITLIPPRAFGNTGVLGLPNQWNLTPPVVDGFRLAAFPAYHSGIRKRERQLAGGPILLSLLQSSQGTAPRPAQPPLRLQPPKAPEMRPWRPRVATPCALKIPSAPW